MQEKLEKYIFFYGFVSHKLLRLMLSISSLTMADIKSHQNCEFSLDEPKVIIHKSRG